MTAERIAGLVERWVRFYTRGLPTALAARRLEEIEADLRDHIADGRARGVGEGRLAFAIASRMLRGVRADTAWRGAARRSTIARSARRIAIGVALVLSIPLAAMRFDSGAAWSLADFVLAGVLLSVLGVVVELAVRRRGNLVAAVAVAAFGVVAAFLGGSDDAPGLVLLGMLFFLSGCALAARVVHRRRRA